MKIQVTQKHIDEGKRGDCFKCALSLAVLDALPHYKKAQVQINKMIGSDEYFTLVTLFHYEGQGLPDGLAAEFAPVLNRFVMDFDAGFPTEPFDFEYILKEMVPRDHPNAAVCYPINR